jgi:hypothetical protein
VSRYHFHVVDGSAQVDEEGTELADVNAAKAEAVRLAGEVLRDTAHGDIWALEEWKLVVNDSPSPESDRTYFTLTLSATDGNLRDDR